MNRFFRVRIRYRSLLKYYFFSSYEEANMFIRGIKETPGLEADIIRYQKPVWVASTALNDIRDCLMDHEERLVRQGYPAVL